MAEKEEAVAILSEILVELTNLFLHEGGLYACSVIELKLEGEEAEVVTRFTHILDYY